MALTDKLSAIADAIRAKTGKTAPMTLDQMPGEISGITTGGGGSSADVRYVTFMNGNTVLYRKPVAVGDDCVNVLTKGLIETPTKESTVQYNYTYYGWGAADNGAADSTILQNITEDKTVYAIYTATVRTYTITYYDSDGTTVLTTQPVAYGTVPSYKPSKSGYVFAGFTTELVEVTGDASYIATWSEKLTFAGATWGDIARISEAGQAADHFALGDTRVISVNGEDKTFQIVGFNHDDLADGSGKAGITCIMKGCTMDEAVVWSSGSSVALLYNKSTVYSTVNSYLSTLDSELQSVIKSVKKKIDGKTFVTVANGTVTTVNCKLWIPSGSEIGYSWYPGTGGWVATLGTKYAWYSTHRNTDYPSTSTNWWLRNLGLPSTNSTQNTAVFNTYKQCVTYNATSAKYIVLGFCI